MTTTELNSTYSQRILREELQRRQSRNAGYSLRALARDLKLPRTTISAVINGKRRLSKGSIAQLTARLSLDESELARLLRESQSEWFETKSENNRRTLEDEEFKLMSSWHYYAILNLARMNDNRAAARWISQRLGLPTKPCREALTLLCKLKLIEIQDGRMIRTASLLQSKRDIPSRYVREQHRQFLELAAQSLDHVDVAMRDISTVTMAICRSRLPQAKTMLLKFRRKLADFLTENGEPDAVYT